MKITGFEGCEKLELLKDTKQDNVFFTYIVWESEEHLQRYRNSEVFESNWSKAKPLFAEKSEAWTVEKID